MAGEGDGLGDGEGLGDGVGLPEAEGEAAGVALVRTAAADVDPHAATSKVASARTPTLRLTGHTNDADWCEVTDLDRTAGA
jgi:hypothetical protein